MTSFTPSERQELILEMVREQAFISTDQMVSSLKVTSQTIRRDLRELEYNGLINRFHGGAGLPSVTSYRKYESRLQTGVEAKRLIGEATARLVPDGASIFLNTGTTTEAVANALLMRKNLHVATNNIHIATILSQNSEFNIMMSGGKVRNEDGGMIGADAHDFFNRFTLDIGIIGISGIDAEGYLLDHDPIEVNTASIVVKNSNIVILVADQEKFIRRGMHRLGHIRDLNIIVTNAPLAPEFKKICDASNVEVVFTEN